MPRSTWSSATETADEVTVRPCEHNWEKRQCTVCQKVCDHGGAEGFDESATTCPYCNAPAVAEAPLNNGEATASSGDLQIYKRPLMQTETAAQNSLLTDVTGDYTINGTQDTALGPVRPLHQRAQ